MTIQTRLICLFLGEVLLDVPVLVVRLPDLSVLCESGHSGALLCVVLRQTGADLQHVRLARLGNHHSVVQWSRNRALVLRLSLLRLLRLRLTLGLMSSNKERNEREMT